MKQFCILFLLPRAPRRFEPFAVISEYIAYNSSTTYFISYTNKIKAIRFSRIAFLLMNFQPA